MLCSFCVTRAEAPTGKRESSSLAWALLSMIGLFFAWMVFYYFGMTLAGVPSLFFGGASQ